MLDGPRLSASSGKTDALVVLLHGYGANGDDLIALGQEWRPALPHASFVAPNAPAPLPMAGFGGLQWFPLTMRDATECWRGVNAASPALAEFVGSELQRHRLTPDRLALVGFSQGTMMALHVGLRMRPPPAAIIAFSGLLAGPEHLAPAAASQPAIMLLHGELDDVIPVEALDVAREALASCGYALEWHRRPGLGHGIDANGLKLAGSFLAQSLP